MFSRAFFVTGIERFDAGRTHKLLAGGFFQQDGILRADGIGALLCRIKGDKGLNKGTVALLSQR